MALLIVRLKAKRHPDAPCDKLDWALCDAQGTPQQSACDIASSEFVLPSQIPEDFTTLVIVPAEDVLVTQVEVPAKQRKHLSKALPFLIEEVLAEPIENMHLVSGNADSRGRIGVLAASHEKMSLWLDFCRQIGLEPDWLITETSCMQVEKGQLSICLDSTSSLIKVGDGPALKSDNRNLENLLELLLDSHPIDSSDAVNLVVTNEASQHCQALIRSTEARFDNGEGKGTAEAQVIDTVFGYLSRSVCEHLAGSKPPVNLLQPPYRITRSKGKNINWRMIGYVAAICVSLQLIFDIAMGFYLNHRASGLEQEITQLYRSLFPGDRKIVNVRVQMENHLSQEADSTNASDFLQMMGIVGFQLKNMNRLTDMQIQQVRYDNVQVEMILDLNVRQVQQLDQFKQQLNGQGLAVTILSASEDRQWVKGRLRISRET